MKRVLAIVPHDPEQLVTHPNVIELETLQPLNHFRSFYLHIVVKKTNHKWMNKKVYFDCGTTAVGSKWITRIQNDLKGRKIITFIKY